jgi:hypothetical protein
MLAATAIASAVLMLSLRPSTVLFLMLLMLFLVPPALDLLRRQFDAFEVRNVFLGLFFLDFVLGGVNAIYFELFWMTKREFSTWINLALIWANVSLLCFYFGYYLPICDKIAAALPEFNSSLNSGRVTVAVVLLTAIGMVAHVALMESVGGIAYYLAHANQSSNLLVGQYYLLMPATRLPIVAAIICYLHGRITGSRSHEHAGVILFAVNMLKQMTLGGRTNLVLQALGFWGIAHYTPRRLSRRRGAVRLIVVPVLAVFFALVMAAATVLHSLGPQTLSGLGGQTNSLALSAEGVEISLSVLGVRGVADMIVERFATLEAFMRVIERAGRIVSPQYGRTFLDVIYGAIPRKLWPEKPYEWPIIFAQYYLDLDTTTGLKPLESPVATWPGELYINFLGPGLILGMILTGSGCRILYSYSIETRTEIVLLFYVLIVLFFLPELDGGLAMAVFSLLVSGVPAWLACVFAKDRSIERLVV